MTVSIPTMYRAKCFDIIETQRFDQGDLAFRYLPAVWANIAHKLQNQLYKDWYDSGMSIMAFYMGSYTYD